ncbi:MULTISPECIES: DUF3180 domain-containing protein [Micrococcaceae]|uniref:DUF3180 domain-containing protein n=1 Tax=unclassified Kocuria TaxID=2649579 RepID=UPI0013ED7EB5|nr:MULTISPECIES: DUF3180 domain-containing protein [unclassified Kocuria]
MRPLRYRWLVLLAAVVLAASSVVTALWPDLREVAFVLPWPSLALSILLAAVSLSLGWRVRAHVKDPKHKPIEPVFAARIAVLGQTCAVYGTVLFGWAGGVLIYELALLRFRPASDTLVLSIANVVVGAVVCIAGCVAEMWCKRPPDDPNSSESGNGISSRRRNDNDIPEGEGGYARNQRR